MKLYLISSIEPEFRDGFSNQTRLQNFKIAQIIAAISLILGMVWRSTTLFYDYEPVLNSFESYLKVNTYFGLVSLFFAAVFILLRKRLMPDELPSYHWIAWMYALLFVIKNVGLSFIAQRNPSNTMAMLLVGLFLVAGVMVFSMLETIAIAGITFCIFIGGLGYFQTDPNLWVSNVVAFFIILSVYILISRLLYTYHANYYKKVRTIEAKNKEIELANESKNELLSMVAHDLRSPLNNIQSLVELMQMPGQEEEQAAYFQLIKDCCDKADRIIREIVAAAQEENSSKLIKNPEHLNTLLQDCFRNWKKVVNNKVKLELILPDEWIVLPIHKDKVQRIIDNLIGNAIKFTPQAHGKISVELKRVKGWVRISVNDNGMGIPADHIPNLFDKFTSAGRLGINNEASIGLGLHISRQFAEQHGGKLWVESVENKGSSFYLDLPA
ncbi:MAG: HAMP domain-containing sensor histidine kinase [Bacteroidota bacterium]